MHEMFKQSKFSDGFDYAKLITALRLATQFLITALPVFHSLFSYKKIKSAGQVDQGGHKVYMFPEPLDKLSPDEEAWTCARLQELGNKLEFILAPKTSSNDTKASCEPRPERLLDLELRGTGSNINISRDLYKMLLKSQNDTMDMISQQMGAFIFATGIIHELGHAAVFASVPTDYQGYQFYLSESGRSTEMGFEITAWLFGGLSEPSFKCGPTIFFDKDIERFSRVEHTLTLCEWPCPSRSLLYEHQCHCPFESRGGKTVEILWTTSFLHIHKMFQDSFWNGVEFRKLGRKALFFDKRTGYRFVPSSTGARQPLLPYPGETFDLPEGFRVDKNGLIQNKGSKLAKMAFSKTREVELAWNVHTIVATGAPVTDWRPVTSREKFESRADKVLDKLKGSALFRSMSKRRVEYLVGE